MDSETQKEMMREMRRESREEIKKSRRFRGIILATFFAIFFVWGNPRIPQDIQEWLIFGICIVMIGATVIPTYNLTRRE